MPEHCHSCAGDVVIALHPTKPGQLICKRIVAEPGDLLLSPSSLDNGQGCHVEREIQLPPGHIWLSGDNMKSSHDSRDYGAVPSQLILGRAVALVRPWLRVAALLGMRRRCDTH